MATPGLNDLCIRLREARRGVGRTQQQVADELGVTRRAVHEWEAGVRRPHSKLPEIAALYGVSTSYLLTGAEEASVELRELRKTVDELYEFVIQLAHTIADDLSAVLELPRPVAQGEEQTAEPDPRERDLATAALARRAGLSSNGHAAPETEVEPGRRRRGSS